MWLFCAVVEGVVVVVVWVCFWRCCWGSFVGSVWWYGMVWYFGTVVGVFCWVMCGVGVLAGALGLTGSNLQEKLL